LVLYFSWHFLQTATKDANVKCTLVQALRLCAGLTGHRGSRGIALLFMTMALEGGEGSVTPLPLFNPGKDPVPIVQEAGWASGPVWTGAENLNSTGIRSPDRPARSQSLCRLRYPAHGCHSTFLYSQQQFLCFIPTNSCKLYRQIPGTLRNSYSCLKVLKGSYKPKTNVNRRSTTSFIACFIKL
jgi:hypothetical protein